MAATMTPSKRARTHAISIAPEATFNTDPGAGYLLVAQWDFDPSALVTSVIENQQVQADLRGVNPNGEGLLFEAATGFNTYLEGLGVGNEAGDGVAAVANGFSELAQVYCGQAYREITGDTVASAAGPNLITPTTPANFEAGDIIGLTDPTTGYFHLRYVEAKDGGTGELTLNLDLPWTPAAAEVIYGTVTNTWQEEMTCSLALKALGKDDYQNFLLLGAVCGLDLPETAAADAQVCNWSVRQASFNKLPFTEAQVPPTAFRPVVAAGGDFYIRRTGQAASAWQPLTYLRSSFSSNQELSPDEDVNSEFGVEAWTRIAQSMELTLHFKNDATVPTGSGTLTTWREFWYDGNEAENEFDIMLSFSRGGPGRSVMLYFPKMRINQPVATNVDVDGKSLQRVVFQPVESTTDSPLIIGQA